MNPSQEYTVKAVCTSCETYHRMTYTWSLHLLNEETGLFEIVEELPHYVTTGK